MLDFAKMHREFAQTNLDNWKEAKAEIDAVEKPAGMPESSLARRDKEGVTTPGLVRVGGGLRVAAISIVIGRLGGCWCNRIPYPYVVHDGSRSGL